VPVKPESAEIIPVQTRRPISNRMQRQPAAQVIAPRPPSSSRALALAGLAAGCLAMLIAAMVAFRRPAPVLDDAKKQPLVKLPVANAPAKPAPALPVAATSTDATATVPALSLLNNEEEDEALKAYETMHREVEASTDRDAQEKLLNAFIGKYSETLQASRARVELSRLAEVKPSPKSPEKQPAPPVTEPPPTSFKLKFEAGSVPVGLSDATLAEKPPAGAHDGTVRVTNGVKWPTVASMLLWHQNFPEGSPERVRKSIFATSPNGKIRFRYFAQRGTYALDVGFIVASSAYISYLCRIDKPVVGEWAVQEVSFTDFKNEKHVLEAGTLCGQLKIGLHGHSNHDFFIDELEVLNDSAPAATTATPATPATPAATAPPPAVTGQPAAAPEIPTTVNIPFDGSKVNGMVDVKVASNPPAGSNAKPMRARTTEKRPQIASLAYSATAFPKDSPQFRHKQLFVSGEGARFRLRYFDTGISDIHVTLAEVGDPYHAYAFYIKDVTKGVWTLADIPLTDFKDKAGKGFVPGTICKHVEVKAIGAENHEFFVDCFEFTAGGK
jgi:hypothetical protein